MVRGGLSEGVVYVLANGSCVNFVSSFATSFYPSYSGKNTSMVPPVLKLHIFYPI